MVRQTQQFQNKVSSAFTMIELIFAIVVVGVTLLTIPLMIQTNNKALEGSITQEAIFLASAVLSVASADVWDDNSLVATNDPDEYVLAKILDVGGKANIGSGGYSRTSETDNIRVGGLSENLHRQFIDYDASAIDGTVGPAQVGDKTLTLTIESSASAIAGYKNTYAVTGRRIYVADTGTVLPTASSATSNLKMIEVSIPVATDANNIITVVLRAYAANIGEVDYAKRSF